MVYITGISVLFGLVGIAFGVRCYIELWKWAKQCQRAQIAVAYKRKVKLQAPLVEWLLWCNQVDKKAANGRVVYAMGGTSIAILQGKTPPSRIRQALKLGRLKRKPTRSPTARTGKWTARDETPNRKVTA